MKTGSENRSEKIVIIRPRTGYDGNLIQVIVRVLKESTRHLFDAVEI
jgi:ribosomal protein S28E/S33